MRNAQPVEKGSYTLSERNPAKRFSTSTLRRIGPQRRKHMSNAVAGNNAVSEGLWHVDAPLAIWQVELTARAVGIGPPFRPRKKSKTTVKELSGHARFFWRGVTFSFSRTSPIGPRLYSGICRRVCRDNANTARRKRAPADRRDYSFVLLSVDINFLPAFLHVIFFARIR